MEFSSWSIVPFLTTRCPSMRFFFKGLGRVTLGVERVQNSIITTGVLTSEPGKKILTICLAICSKKRYMSIFATHKYNIIDLFNEAWTL